MWNMILVDLLFYHNNSNLEYLPNNPKSARTPLQASEKLKKIFGGYAPDLQKSGEEDGEDRGRNGFERGKGG